MKLIVGLGNIGSKYAKTRHNLGFMVLDELTKQLGVKDLAESTDAKIYRTSSENILAYPKLMMNNSGKIVSRLSQQFGVDVEDILVIRDDIDLPFGKIKGPYKSTGSGGHQGIESILKSLASNEFYQLKFGFGRPVSDREVNDFVTEEIPVEQNSEVAKAILEMARLARLWLGEDQ